MKKVEFELVLLKDSGAYKHFDIVAKKVYVNGKMVWSKFKDDVQEEMSLAKAVLTEWHNVLKKDIEATHTEKNRLQWKMNHPRDMISLNELNWKQHKEKLLEAQKNDMNSVWNYCHILPKDEELQLKMIALWIESHNDEEIEVLSNVIQK